VRKNKLKYQLPTTTAYKKQKAKTSPDGEGGGKKNGAERVGERKYKSPGLEGGGGETAIMGTARATTPDSPIKNTGGLRPGVWGKTDT